MGLDDRDYMRERRRAEARLGSASWIDRKGRVEHGGSWFGPGERGFDYRQGRYRSGSSFRIDAERLLVWLLAVLLVIIPAFGGVKRAGWLPDLEPAVPFPASGSVTISPALDVSRVTSSLTVRTSAANAVVQLFDPVTDRHILSVYARGDDRVRLPVPSGSFLKRLIEGQRWHGGVRFFGPNTSYETVVQRLNFSSTGGHEIDLRRRPGGNLATRMMIAGPDRL